MRAIVLLLAVVLSACSMQQAADYSPAGTDTGEFTVYCEGDWVDCYEQASTRCGERGYRETGMRQAEPIDLNAQQGRTGPDDGWNLTTGPEDGMVTFRCD